MRERSEKRLPEPEGATRAGIRIQATGLTVRVRGGLAILDDVSLALEPGEVVAIVGGSGAGKTTLLDALAGVRPADEGTVRFDGAELYGDLAAWRRVLGYVPQDDIIHTELPLARTLTYAARLRLRAGAGGDEIRRVVVGALRSLDLQERADVPVRALSGGQRKRASIAVELLTDPRVCFLDEPTSGLDPATGAELLRVLRRLAASGATVVFTTHAPQDVAACDRVVFLARGGHLAFTGTPRETLSYFEVNSVEEVYERLAAESTPTVWAERFREYVPDRQSEAAGEPPSEAGGPPVGPGRQWWVLTQRTYETLVRNPLTLAILVGSPAVVLAMFAILFQPGAFDVADPQPSAILMIVFWITFGSFFFGLTYGLLQVVTERAILRREHLVGLRLGPYLLSKLAVLLPFLLAVNAAMLWLLRLLDRLPAGRLSVYASVWVTLALLAAAALGLGLLTSAAVGNPAQATLALPMLSFPAVLFSGAILPVHIMTGVGKAISAVVPVRWAFEAVGRDLGVRELLLRGGSPLGRPLVASYGEAGMRPTGEYWAILASFVLILLIAGWLVLRRTARSSPRS